MEFDALTAGVAPGGLNNRTDIRILICYILSAFKEPVPVEAFKEVMHFEGIANYFEVGNALGDLCGNGHIKRVDCNGILAYTATESGADIAATLESDLPVTVREHARDATARLLARKRHERENKVEITSAPNGCYVTCTVLEGDYEQLSVRLLVPDESRARAVKDIFLDDPAVLYMNVVETLTDTQMRFSDKK